MISYIGTKVVDAEIMTDVEFAETKGKNFEEGHITKKGYRVVYPDGYDSWSPMEVFEQAYRPISHAEKALIVKPTVPESDTA